MDRYLWPAHLGVAILVGWGGLTWLTTMTSPQQPLARLAFVGSLALGLYATATLVAYAACLMRWPAAPGFAVRAFSRRQGFLWAGLAATLTLLCLSGELTAFTLGVTVLAFVAAQYLQLRQAG